MAEAPTPGVSRRREQREAAQQIMVLTIKGEEFRLAVGNLPMNEKLVLRRATGLPIEAFVGNRYSIGEDSVIVLWWLARRAGGEATLSFGDAVAQWPVGLTGEDFEIEVEDPEGDDPEA